MVDNEKITPDVILSGDSIETVERIKKHSIVLVAQDTTWLDYSNLHAIEGLGTCSSEHQKDLFLHTSMALTTTGVPLGILKQLYWARGPIDPERDYTKPPKNKPSTKGAPNLQLYAVLAQEVSIPPEGVKPIRWVLLTDIKVETLEDAVKIVKWYTQRWKIERFHYVLKSGCNIDDLQLGTGDRLENVIAIYSIVAWKILYMTYESRENPYAEKT